MFMIFAQAWSKCAANRAQAAMHCAGTSEQEEPTKQPSPNPTHSRAGPARMCNRAGRARAHVIIVMVKTSPRNFTKGKWTTFAPKERTFE
ncbi:MAG: hypothetical protein FWD06_02145 [Oscillospiraceae bacterium]|nr:hypothetical protein [Oscillospiraceae bacterium]